MENKEIKMSVKLSTLKKVVEAAEQFKGENEDPDVSFEFLIASLFPACWYNIQDTLKQAYTNGYKQGLEERDNNGN